MDIRVGTIGLDPGTGLEGYRIDKFDPFEYLSHDEKNSLLEIPRSGIGSYKKHVWLYTAEGVDKLYRQRDPSYMALIEAFVEKFKNHDLLIISSFNPIHPDVLHHELKKPIKVLGFIDDPVSSYTRGIPYLWAFDGAFYISPSYSEHERMADKLHQWGCVKNHWWPLVPYENEGFDADESFFADRDLDVCYVGGAYGDKIDRLQVLKKHFGARFHLHGRWPLKGMFGTARILYGKPALLMRVTSLTHQQRRDLYLRTRIGFNMHLSSVPRETGNMRMYEIPAHGMMQVCDVAGQHAEEGIYQGGIEAVYYQSIDEAISLIERYLEDDDERLRIARAGYERVQQDYRWVTCMTSLLAWASNLRTRQDQ